MGTELTVIHELSLGCGRQESGAEERERALREEQLLKALGYGAWMG